MKNVSIHRINHLDQKQSNNSNNQSFQRGDVIVLKCLQVKVARQL